MTMHDFINAYNHTSYTHDYIFGYALNGKIFLTFATSEILEKICKLDKASEKCGGGFSLRFIPNNTQKMILFSMNHSEICTVSEFDEAVKNSIYNKGEIFEKMVSTKFGIEWKKDNVPYTIAGDIEINGNPYQIKFTKATFMTERQYRAVA